MISVLFVCADFSKLYGRTVEDSLFSLSVSNLIKENIASSANGEAISLYRFPSALEEYEKATYKFYIQGGLHGNEGISTAFVSWLMKRVDLGQSLLNQLSSDHIAIDFLPAANPDGLKRNVRLNSHGVDLNRNFGVLWGKTSSSPGISSFSEPETRAIKTTLDNGHYTVAVDVHGFVNWLVAPSTYTQVKLADSSIDSRNMFLQNTWMGILKDRMSELPGLEGYELKTAGGLGDGGAFEDYAFWKANALAFCMEIESAQSSTEAFLKYEKFLYEVFKSAIALKSHTSKNVAEETPAKATQKVLH